MPIAHIPDNDLQRGKLVRNGGNFILDNGLESAVWESLLTNRRLDPGDPRPPSGQRGGWWGDHEGSDQDPAHPSGSKLWTLSGAPLHAGTVRKAALYAREALAWMIEDGIADRVETRAEITGPNVLGFTVRIHRPGDEDDRWLSFWQAIALDTLTGEV